MPRKTSRPASGLDEEVPRQALTQITRVYKRPKKDTTTNAGKENNNNISNTLANVKQADTKKQEITTKKQLKKEEPKKKTKEPAKKEKEVIVTKKEPKKENTQIDDYLRQQQEYFKSVDEFELTVEAEPIQRYDDSIPTVALSQELPKKSSESPFLKDLIDQEFKKQHDKQTHKQATPPSFSPTSDREDGEVAPTPYDEQDESMFGYDDYNNLVDELDAELSYLKAPKDPKIPFLPCPIMRAVDPTESDFPMTPAHRVPATPDLMTPVTPAILLPKPNKSPRFAYQEYKTVVEEALVGQPMSFEEFMSRQRT